MEKRNIPVSRPSVGMEEIEEIKKVFDSGWLGLGSTVFEFEKKLSEYLGGRDVIAVNTGTTALHVALDALGIADQDEVIVPSLTFCASVQVITALRAVPVFCEICPETLSVNVEDVRRRITSRTKAIMPVHYCGQPCDMEALLALGQKHHISIVEDAAHAFGSSYHGRKIGSFGDVTCFSFDPIKNITCGEGGAVVLGDEGIAEEIRRKRVLGIDKDTWHRYRNERSWFYEVTTQGYRYHMSNINAAIGIAQLLKFDNFIYKKRDIVRQYNDAFQEIMEIKLLHWDLQETVPFAYIVRVKADQRDSLMDYLNGRGVGAGIHYIANHLQPFFKGYATSLPVTEGLWREILTLPLYTEMKDEEVKYVISSVQAFFKK